MMVILVMMMVSLPIGNDDGSTGDDDGNTVDDDGVDVLIHIVVQAMSLSSKMEYTYPTIATAAVNHI